MSFERPRFDQPKTPEIIKAPTEVANEIRARIIALNEKLRGRMRSESQLQIRCDKEGNQEACRMVERIRKIEIPQISHELDSAVRELDKVTAGSR